MDAFYHHIVPLLPFNLQEVAYNPPSLTNPSSFIPFFKLIFPYTKYILILSSVYILWSFLSGIFGMFSRVLRFSMKIGPLIGLVAWLMNSSGQGSMDELFGLVKQYFGLQPAGGVGGWSPGIANLASSFLNNNNNNNNGGGGGQGFSKSGIKKATKNPWSNGDSDPISSRTRNNKKANKNANAGDLIENLINTATNEENVNELGNVVQDFVKNSLTKAAGLDWLFGNGNSNEQKENDKSKFWKSR